MVLMPKPQASTPRSEKQKSHEKKRDCIQELVYGETKRQKNVEGVWTEMASQFMMSDTDLMRTVPAPTSRATRSPLPTTRTWTPAPVLSCSFVSSLLFKTRRHTLYVSV